jgi:hypothetical protein
MGLRSCFGCLAISIGVALATPSASRSECGPLEDASRTSYRRIAWEDFQPARRFEVGPTEARVRAEIATSVALDDWQPVVVESASKVTARVGALCIRAYMLKDRSRRAPQRQRGDLSHEQGHFDITQLFAGKLATRVAALSVPIARPEAAEDALLRAIRAVYRETMAELQAAQARYESETAFGNERGPQARWERELAAQLAPPEG